MRKSPRNQGKLTPRGTRHEVLASPDEQAAIRTLIEGTLLRHHARRLAAS